MVLTIRYDDYSTYACTYVPHLSPYAARGYFHLVFVIVQFAGWLTQNIISAACPKDILVRDVACA